MKVPTQKQEGQREAGECRKCGQPIWFVYHGPNRNHTIEPRLAESKGHEWGDPDCPFCGGCGVTETVERTGWRPCPRCCVPASEVERLREAGNNLASVISSIPPGFTEEDNDQIDAALTKWRAALADDEKTR